MSKMFENKRFWRTIKPFFTDKTKNSNNVILTENYPTVREDEKIKFLILILPMSSKASSFDK